MAGSAPTSCFSRPARRSLTLRPACSRGRRTTLSIEGFGDLVTSIAAPIATGWSESCRVGIAPTEDRHLFTARHTNCTETAQKPHTNCTETAQKPRSWHAAPNSLPCAPTHTRTHPRFPYPPLIHVFYYP